MGLPETARARRTASLPLPGPRDVNSVDPRRALLDGYLQCLRATEIGEAYELVVVLEKEHSCRDMVSRRAKRSKGFRERGLKQAHLVGALLSLHGATTGRVLQRAANDRRSVTIGKSANSEPRFRSRASLPLRSREEFRRHAGSKTIGDGLVCELNEAAVAAEYQES